MLENLKVYLQCNDLADTTEVSQNEDGTFKIITKGTDIPTTIQNIKVQVDRDSEHPITIMGVDYISTVISQDDSSVTVKLEKIA